MRKGYYLIILLLLTMGSSALTATAASQAEGASSMSFDSICNLCESLAQKADSVSPSSERATLTVYVIDESAIIQPLAGVAVTSRDAAGNVFDGMTDSNGSVVIEGQPGTWEFSFLKEGYETLSLKYNVTENHAAAAYLQRLDQTTDGIEDEPQSRPQGESQSQSQEPVALTVYVHDGSLDGEPISDVQVAGHDAAGSGFQGTTGTDGSSVVEGQPGTWQFTFTKEGYRALGLSYNVTETHEADAYLERIDQSEDQSEEQSLGQSLDQSGEQSRRQPHDQVALTIYVHDGSLDGAVLSDVQVAAQDAAGNAFEGVTDMDGSVVMIGEPGTWQFTFAKEGYGTLGLSYNVTETHEADAYLEGVDQSQEPAISSQSYQQPDGQPVS